MLRSTNPISCNVPLSTHAKVHFVVVENLNCFPVLTKKTGDKLIRDFHRNPYHRLIYV